MASYMGFCCSTRSRVVTAGADAVLLLVLRLLMIVQSVLVLSADADVASLGGVVWRKGVASSIAKSKPGTGT